MHQITKEMVEALAQIIGPFSAAQKCIDASKSMKNPKFFRTHDSMVVVDEPGVEATKWAE
jgi:hypothetical protein